MPILPTRRLVVLLAVLLASGILRFYGLGWGTDRQTEQFHTFHPDERTVVENARWVGEDLSRIGSGWPAPEHDRQRCPDKAQALC